MSTPAISIIMATKDRVLMLKECIDSVLAQTFDNFELIIVNDASVDATSELVSSYSDLRIRLIENTFTEGLASSLHKALSCVRGDYVARMDDDDICHPQRLAKQKNVLDNLPNINLVATFAHLFSDAGIIGSFTSFRDSRYLPFYLSFECPICHPSVMFRRSWIECIGGYRMKIMDPSVIYGPEDYEIWTRCEFEDIQSGFYVIDEHLLSYRVHSKKLTGSVYATEFNANLRLIRSSYVRRVFDLDFPTDRVPLGFCPSQGNSELLIGVNYAVSMLDRALWVFYADFVSRAHISLYVAMYLRVLGRGSKGMADVLVGLAMSGARVSTKIILILAYLGSFGSSLSSRFSVCLPFRH